MFPFKVDTFIWAFRSSKFSGIGRPKMLRLFGAQRKLTGCCYEFLIWPQCLVYNNAGLWPHDVLYDVILCDRKKKRNERYRIRRCHLSRIAELQQLMFCSDRRRLDYCFRRPIFHGKRKKKSYACPLNSIWFVGVANHESNCHR